MDYLMLRTYNLLWRIYFYRKQYLVLIFSSSIYGLKKVFEGAMAPRRWAAYLTRGLEGRYRCEDNLRNVFEEEKQINKLKMKL